MAGLSHSFDCFASKPTGGRRNGCAAGCASQSNASVGAAPSLVLGSAFTATGLAVVSTGVSVATGKANVFIRYDGQYGSLQSGSAITRGVVFTW